MVGQVLIVAVQNGVDRRGLGVATAATSFFRALGGAVGAAVSAPCSPAARRQPDARADVIDAVQTVFLVAAPVAALACRRRARLEEVPLRQTTQERRQRCPIRRSAAACCCVARDRRPPAAIEITVAAGWSGPPLHHHDFDEAFSCSPESSRSRSRTSSRTAGPGALAFAPRGVHHTLANLSGAEARYLLVCTPGGFERRFDPAPSGPLPGDDLRRAADREGRPRHAAPRPGGPSRRSCCGASRPTARSRSIDSVVPADAKGPYLHTHDFDEAFYIVEGELTFQVEDRLVTVRKGEIAFAPRGVPHTFTNRSGEPARQVIVCTPAGFERHFARMAAEARRRRAARVGAAADPGGDRASAADRRRQRLGSRDASRTRPRAAQAARRRPLRARDRGRVGRGAAARARARASGGEGLDPRRARRAATAHQRVRERRARRAGHAGRRRGPGRRAAGDLGRMAR